MVLAALVLLVEAAPAKPWKSQSQVNVHAANVRPAPFKRWERRYAAPLGPSLGSEDALVPELDPRDEPSSARNIKLDQDTKRSVSLLGILS